MDELILWAPEGSLPLLLSYYFRKLLCLLHHTPVNIRPQIGGKMRVICAAIVAALLHAAAPARAAVSVDSCPESGPGFHYYFEYCASSTQIASVTGNCTADGIKTEDTEIAECASSVTVGQEFLGNDEWSDSPAVYCHECSVSGTRAVCADSDSAADVCNEVEDRGCGGLLFEYFTWPCQSEQGKYNFMYTQCGADGTRTSTVGDTFDCRIHGFGTNCLNCQGLEICAPKGDSSCDSVLNGSPTEAPVVASPTSPINNTTSSSSLVGLEGGLLALLALFTL